MDKLKHCKNNDYKCLYNQCQEEKKRRIIRLNTPLPERPISRNSGSYAEVGSPTETRLGTIIDPVYGPIYDGPAFQQSQNYSKMNPVYGPIYDGPAFQRSHGYSNIEPIYATPRNSHASPTSIIVGGSRGRKHSTKSTHKKRGYGKRTMRKRGKRTMRKRGRKTMRGGKECNPGFKNCVLDNGEEQCIYADEICGNEYATVNKPHPPVNRGHTSPPPRVDRSNKPVDT